MGVIEEGKNSALLLNVTTKKAHTIVTTDEDVRLLLQLLKAVNMDMMMLTIN